jgi:ubiquinone/menaquinone biosynthesis C-methylase UbiE
MTIDLHQSFRGDGSADEAVAAMAAFLDGADRVPAVRAIRAAMRRQLLDREVPPADFSLLDAACGAGTETRQLANMLPGRHVVGLDHNRGLLELAAARERSMTISELAPEPATAESASDRSLEVLELSTGRVAVDTLPVVWICADMRDAGLPDASVAAVRVERGLIYLENPEVAVAEFARVLVPGGVLVAYELDYGGLLLPIGTASPDLIREVNAVMEASLPTPWAGRRLARWMEGTGLTDVTVSPMSICAGPAVANRIVGDTVRTAVAQGRLRADALDWLDTCAFEPPGLPAITVAGFLTTAVKPTLAMRASRRPSQ